MLRLTCACMVLACGLASAARLRTMQHEPKPYRQPLENFQNTQYFADLTIGGQPIKGIFDTGSFELLVRSTRCKHCANPTPAYDHTKSKTYVENGTMVQHVFGSGPCVSMQGYDTVGVGPMTAKAQNFWEIVDHRIDVLNMAKFAAIVGIGPFDAPTNDEKTLLMSYGVQEFSICLQRGSGTPGYLTWGPVASVEEKRKNFATVPVMGKLHWAAQMTGVRFAGVGVDQTNHPDICGGKGCAGIVDSGTSLIAAPTEALMALSKVVGNINEDCSNLHTLPTLTFMLGDKPFELPPHAYVMRIQGAVMEADTMWDLLFFKPKMKKLNMCIPAFMQMDMQSPEGPVWILGMPFFRYYHVSFDRKEKAMHFANAGEGCEPKPYKLNVNGTALLSMERRAVDFEPTDIDVDALIPPSLSSMLEAGKEVVL